MIIQPDHPIAQRVLTHLSDPVGWCGTSSSGWIDHPLGFSVGWGRQNLRGLLRVGHIKDGEYVYIELPPAPHRYLWLARLWVDRYELTPDSGHPLLVAYEARLRESIERHKQAAYDRTCRTLGVDNPPPRT